MNDVGGTKLLSGLDIANAFNPDQVGAGDDFFKVSDSRSSRGNSDNSTEWGAAIVFATAIAVVLLVVNGHVGI